MRRFCVLMVGGIVAAPAAGCGTNPAWRNKIFHPGPTQYQQQNAEKFDPYNEISVGPRDDTSRPLSYREPNPEAAQGRWDAWGWPRYGHHPPTEYELSAP